MADRLFREGFLDSEKVNALTDFAERLFVRLILAADDAGRLDGRIAILRAKARPLDSARRDKDYEAALAEIYKAELAFPYEFDGRPYVQITRHQHSTPALMSKFPNHKGDYAITVVSKPSPKGVKKYVSESLPPYEGRLTEGLPKGYGLPLPTCAGTGTGTGTVIAPSFPSKSPEPPFVGSGLSFIVAGGAEWEAPAKLIDELVKAYPGVNVRAECLKARAWTVTAGAKRKTPGGMPTCLNRWMNKAQNDGPRMQPTLFRQAQPQILDPAANDKKLAALQAMGKKEAK